MRRWCAENLYGFGKEYKEIRLDQWTGRQMEAIEALRREQAYLEGPSALAACDREQEKKIRDILGEAQMGQQDGT